MQSFDERYDDLPPVVRLRRLELLPVVTLLPCGKPLLPVSHLEEPPGLFAHHCRFLLSRFLSRRLRGDFRLGLAPFDDRQKLELVPFGLELPQSPKVHGRIKILDVQTLKSCIYLFGPITSIPLRIVLVSLLGALLQCLGLQKRELRQKHLHPPSMQTARIRQVSTHLGKQPLIRRKHQIQGTFVDVARREGRQKVVPDEHTEEHKVVDHPLDVKCERQT
mmetsp:Transcript_6826/g.18900  ORF Transcript_6826/g.18900 Transcript_6826/m.18900 type:complete len:220 (+) Transcript_6826:2785-3444(+)